MKAVQLQITGKVQGVWYRKTSQDKANELNLVGYVKNEADGSVKVFVQGNDQAITTFVDWCNEGPKNARVEKVAVTPAPINTELNYFTILK